MIKTIDELLDKLRSEGRDIRTLQRWREGFAVACKQLQNQETLGVEEFKKLLIVRDMYHDGLQGCVMTLRIIGEIDWKEEDEIQRNLRKEYENREKEEHI